jgi:hypothetical protein
MNTTTFAMIRLSVTGGMGIVLRAAGLGCQQDCSRNKIREVYHLNAGRAPVLPRGALPTNDLPTRTAFTPLRTRTPRVDRDCFRRIHPPQIGKEAG